MDHKDPALMLLQENYEKTRRVMIVLISASILALVLGLLVLGFQTYCIYRTLSS